jgi:AraC-like DNA-binding protein
VYRLVFSNRGGIRSLNTPTFLASNLRILLRLLEHHHIDSLAICREYGLNPDLADDPQARYPADQFIAAWEQAYHLIGLPSLGLEVPNFFRPTDLHALGYSFLASTTLRAALERLVRYGTVLNSKTAFHLEEAGQNIALCCARSDIASPVDKIMEDARAAIITHLCRMGGEQTLNPVTVEFTYPEPNDLTAYQAFFQCPMAFNASELRLVFSMRVADRPFSSANSDLARSSDQVLVSLLNNLQDETIVSKVKKAIAEHLPSGTPKEARIANTVFMSKRTLQRELARQGTTFTQSLDEVRRQLAERYIANQALPLTEISYLLGFSGVTAFSRAFKRWTGSSPGHYRKVGQGQCDATLAG